MQKFSIKRFVYGFRFDAAEAQGDWKLGEEFEIPTGDYVQIIIQEPDVDGIDLVVAIAEFDIARNGLDWVVRNVKRWMLENNATAEDVKLLKRKINEAATYCGNRNRG